MTIAGYHACLVAGGLALGVQIMMDFPSSAIENGDVAASPSKDFVVKFD